MNRAEARAAVAAAARQLAAAGLVIGTSGNVSCRLDGTDAGLLAVTATGVALARATARDVTIVDQHGTVVEGQLAPTSELPLHLGLLGRPEVGAVVHTHSPVATALSLVLDEVPVVHYQQLELGGSVPVVPFAVFGSAALATSVGAALRQRRAALLAHHGTVTIGPDVSTATQLSLLLEWVCALYWRARAVGMPSQLSLDDQQAVIEFATQTRYGTPRPAEPLS